MSIKRKLKLRSKRRKLRTKGHLKNNSRGIRVSVYRSLKQISAQLIDDVAGKTIASCSSLEKDMQTGNKKDRARLVGLELAKRALKKNIDKVVFDRNGKLYHGRIKALAEGLREGGLTI